MPHTPPPSPPPAGVPSDPVTAARAHQAVRRTRRFYTDVTTHAVTEGGHGVCLDGRPVRTPSQGPLAVPTAALAEAIAAEWAAQGEEIDPAAMPLSQLANTALERTLPGRSALVAELIHYVDADLLCYRAAHPTDLVARQHHAWQPLVDWAAEALSARLAVTDGVMPLRQPTETAEALRAALDALDPWALTAAQCVAGATGSLVLALALTHGRVDGETCFTLSRLDETFQMEQWGEDREAMLLREAVRRDILASETLWRLTRA
ncbi:ATPase [Roseospira marina]|uniref:ATPase n=1 Tax=Roseospira marina TaxID=140057 RepID=A0A5M6IH53_9PROT|nr:ATP12 family protein [Roseospira marina]KAA5607636.1 ATPase [Roseospira marina]MBB5085820.1 chaperone required for assembly of F1-ATPase [Roseospira marina]